MSVKLISLVFEHYQGPPAEKFFAICVLDHGNHDGTGIYPGIPALADKSGMSERTVQRYLQVMIKKGWLEVVKNGTGGRGNATEYRVPEAIVKGDKLSPFTKPERVTTMSPFKDEKGDNQSTKGCQPAQERVTTSANIVCEPSENRQEPYTLTPLAPSDEQTTIHLPLNSGEQFAVHEAQVRHWIGLFPAVDVRQELRNMLAWLEASPNRRKTKSGILRFITGWLAREQNRGGQHAARQSPHPSRAQRVSQRLDDIARQDAQQHGVPDHVD